MILNNAIDKMCFVVIAYCALVGKPVISCIDMRIRVTVSFIVQQGLYSIEKAFEFDCFSWIPWICMKALKSPGIVTEVLEFLNNILPRIT